MIRLRATRYGATSSAHRERERRSRGYSLVELLVALTVCTLISSAIAGVVGPARAAFDSAPGALELQQRAHTAADVVSRILRSGGMIADSGSAPAILPAALLLDPDQSSETRFDSLYAISRTGAAHALLEIDQATTSAPLVLSATQCPVAGTVCGFSEGMIAAIADGTGRFDVFEIVAIDAAARALIASVPFDPPYSSGATLVAVEAHRYWLERNAEGSSTLMRDSAGGAVQPVVDDVTAVSFEGWREGESATDLVPLETAEARDGPWHQGGPEGSYDEDMRRLRRIDITMRIIVRSVFLRRPASDLFDRNGSAAPTPSRWVPDRVVKSSITLRNLR